MPGTVRVTTANSQLSQFLKRLYLPFLPFPQRAWAVLRSVCNPSALSVSLRWSRGTCQVPHLELPSRSQASRSLPFRSAFLAISRESAITLTVLLQATGPVLQEVRLPVSVWSPTPPCALLTRLPPPRLGLCSAPRFLRLASSDQSTYTVPFFVHRHLHLPVLECPMKGCYEVAPGLRRLPV